MPAQAVVEGDQPRRVVGPDRAQRDPAAVAEHEGALELARVRTIVGRRGVGGHQRDYAPRARARHLGVDEAHR
ncbi:MAG: hypothetical protein A3D33_21625 [Candidatus Rokubacteria bacterium RIFCSPHIGHO2_02_FULL_73_26]|nr:MAG: hypothetical protein A3D33_21625 [Candidatus Rokubacteria bacterium RIFCSPHIGHO2_02_FULL_73_26]